MERRDTAAVAGRCARLPELRHVQVCSASTGRRSSQTFKLLGQEMAQHVLYLSVSATVASHNAWTATHDATIEEFQAQANPILIYTGLY